MRLLLVEDDQTLGSGLRKGLERAGYSVEWMKGGEDAVCAAEAGDFETMVLDINLPDISGLDVMRRVRANAKIKGLPTLMLTALDGDTNIVKGLDTGADDYLTKPFDLNVLLARLRALRRRADHQPTNILRCGNIELDTSGRGVTVSGKPVNLAARELKVLTLLMHQRGHIVGKSRIEEELYGWDEGIESNTVEASISKLRRQLGKDVIITMRNVGYTIPE